MKNYHLYILLVFFCHSCSITKSNSTEKELGEDDIIFNRGVAIFNLIYGIDIYDDLEYIDSAMIRVKEKYGNLSLEKEEILLLAANEFEIIIEDYTTSDLYHKSLYNLAQINATLDNEEEELRYLNLILDSDADDKERSGRDGLMSNPYANFKNEASGRLTNFYIEKGDFEKALEYKKLNDKYPYQHFCGNAYLSEKSYSTRQYAEIHLGLGDEDKALNVLLPHVLGNVLGDDAALVDMTIDVLFEHKEKPTLKKDFHQAMNEISSKIENEWTVYYIEFLNNKIKIPYIDYTFEEVEDDILHAKLRERIKESYFYQKLYEEAK